MRSLLITLQPRLESSSPLGGALLMGRELSRGHMGVPAVGLSTISGHSPDRSLNSTTLSPSLPTTGSFFSHFRAAPINCARPLACAFPRPAYPPSCVWAATRQTGAMIAHNAGATPRPKPALPDLEAGLVSRDPNSRLSLLSRPDGCQAPSTMPSIRSRLTWEPRS